VVVIPREKPKHVDGLPRGKRNLQLKLNFVTHQSPTIISVGSKQILETYPDISDLWAKETDH